MARKLEQLEVTRVRLDGAESSLHSLRAQKEELEMRLDAMGILLMSLLSYVSTLHSYIYVYVCVCVYACVGGGKVACVARVYIYV